MRIVSVQTKSGFSCAAHVMESSDKAIVNFLKETYKGMRAVLSFVSRPVYIRARAMCHSPPASTPPVSAFNCRMRNDPMTCAYIV